jgi:hypothetical protein
MAPVGPTEDIDVKPSWWNNVTKGVEIANVAQGSANILNGFFWMGVVHDANFLIFSCPGLVCQG